MAASRDDRHTPQCGSKGVGERPSHRVLGIVKAEDQSLRAASSRVR